MILNSADDVFVLTKCHQQMETFNISLCKYHQRYIIPKKSDEVKVVKKKKL